MKVKIKHQTTKEVEFEFPSFFKSKWYDKFVYFAAYSETECHTLFWDGSVNKSSFQSAFENMERYQYELSSREEYREHLAASCELLIQQTY